ncbi:MAG TPA: protein kinase [Polyangiaceae bacterium]|nr:protein kinase [Polyangiaceae bacterium]
MTNRAHHPAERGSGEFAKDDPDAPANNAPGVSAPAGSGPASAGVDEAVSREFALPTNVERVFARAADADDDDDDAEEVVPEPESGNGSLSATASEAAARGSEPPAESGERADAAGAVGSGDAPEPALDASLVETPIVRAVVPPPLVEMAAEPTLSPAPSAPVDAANGEPETKALASSPRRSQPPPLPPGLVPPAMPAASAAAGSNPSASAPAAVPAAAAPALAARELEAPRGDFSNASTAEMTAAELESTAGSAAPSDETWSESRAPAEGAKRPSFRPPFVDEVPDPVTPYEKRVSETVKVADLPPVEQLRGRVLANRYLAEEVAEHTACSISYRTYHLALDRAVTVRVLLRGLACTDDAAKEVRRVAAEATALEHPHVGATLDFGVLSDGWPFVVTEHFQGNTLATLISNEGKFVLRRVLHVGKQLAQGLAAAHAKGIVHGLLSPDNVLVVEPGSSAEVAKILGFGVSKARGPQPGPPRSGVFGVPFYVSPEQAACRTVDERSDIYSLGVILYELMTGSPPFSDGDFAGVLCQHLDDESPSPSTRLPSPGALAKALDAIIERCLRKEPEKRYQTAAELADDLVRLEAAAARTKRRPMPEVQKPTSTIHSPHRKAEAPEVPGAKVIVHDDIDDDAVSPEPPEVAARRSSPGLTRSSPAASTASGKLANTTPASGNSLSAPPVPPGARTPAGATGPAGKRPSGPPPLTPVAASPRPVRVRVDQATIKISAVDRERILAERQGNRGSWLSSVMAAIRRLLAQPDGGDDTR